MTCISSAVPQAPHPNRVPKEIEEAILAHAMDHPTHDALRGGQELSLKCVQTSSVSIGIEY